MVPDAEVHHKYAPSHIRAENGIAKSWLQIMTSTAYYIVRNAVPEMPLTARLERVAFHQHKLRNDTNRFRSENLIDDVRHAELMREIDEGTTRGITHAFEFPERQLIARHSPSPWYPLVRRSAEQRIRIALVTRLYPPRPCGGVAVFMRTLAATLAKEGHEVTVITQAEQGRSHTVDFEDGAWIHRLPMDDRVESAHPAGMPDMPPTMAAFAGRVLAELDRVNARRQIQYVIGSIWDVELAAVIASGRYLTGMYLVTSYMLMQDSKPEWRRDPRFRRNVLQKMIAAERWAIDNCTQVLASTGAIVKDVCDLYDVRIADSRCVITPFGIDDVEHLSCEEEELKNLRLLFVGRLEERKGIGTVIAALPQIMPALPDMVIDIVGDDQLTDADGITFRQRFEKLYGSADWIDRVHFHGHVDDAQLTSFYRNCSIFLAPSKYESFGLIYLEAMRFAKPCIGSKSGGIPEVVEDGVTGILIEPGNAEQLADAVFRLARTPKLRTEMGLKGRARFDERFTVNRFARSIVSHVEGLLQSHGRSKGHLRNRLPVTKRKYLPVVS
jgi:hypothetical protein